MKKLCILDRAPKKSSLHFPQRRLGLLLGRKLHWMNQKSYPKHSCKWFCKTENLLPYNCNDLSCCYKVETLCKILYGILVWTYMNTQTFSFITALKCWKLITLTYTLCIMEHYLPSCSHWLTRKIHDCHTNTTKFSF